jgi:hypothetical protein
MKSNIWGEQGIKITKGKKRYLRKTKIVESSNSSPVELTISVEGKSPYEQVDLLLGARLLTLKTENAYCGH